MAKTKNNTYQVFPRDYFSGIDCYVSFDNIPIDEIVSIQFAIQEPILPIYGYASYTYDAVAHGARLVSGSFRINYKEAMYIRTALQKLVAQNTSSINPKKPTSYMSKNELLSWMKGQRISDIEKIADEYGELLWSGKSEMVDKYNDPFFTTKGSNLSEYGFDIILSYGDELLEIGTKYDIFPGAVDIINGVHLTGVQKIVQPTGDPIYEEYSFIAKDLDNALINRG